MKLKLKISKYKTLMRKRQICKIFIKFKLKTDKLMLNN